MIFVLLRLQRSSRDPSKRYLARHIPFITDIYLPSQLKCLLFRLLKISSRASSLLSGAAAGLSLLLVPAADRRTFVIFSIVRAGEFIARSLALGKQLPQAFIDFAYWDVLIMCLSAMQILFAYVACPHVCSLPRGFLSNLLNLF